MFRSLWKIIGKSSEVAWTFSEILVTLMTRQNSHAFVLEKVERYSIMMHCLTKVPTVHKQTDQRIYHVTLFIKKQEFPKTWYKLTL